MKLDNIKINELNLELDNLKSQAKKCNRIRNEIDMECERAMGGLSAYDGSAVMYNVMVLQKLIDQIVENVNMSRDLLRCVRKTYEDINDKMRD